MIPISTFHKCFLDAIRIRSWYWRNPFRILQKYFHGTYLTLSDTFRIPSEYFLNTFSTLLDTSRVLRKYFPGTYWTLSEYFINTFLILTGHFRILSEYLPNTFWILSDTFPIPSEYFLDTFSMLCNSGRTKRLLLFSLSLSLSVRTAGGSKGDNPTRSQVGGKALPPPVQGSKPAA